MKIFLQGLSIAAVAAALIMIVWRALPNMGVPLKKRIDKPAPENGFEPDRKDCARVFLYSMLFRVFVIAAAFVAYCIFIDGGNKLHLEYIFKAWEKWDAPHYISIAQGYASHTENGDYLMLVFFPLYSWLLAAMNVVVRNFTVSGLIVSALCSSAGIVYLYRLVAMDYGRRTAQITALLTLVFPFGYYYGAIMSESVFLLTSVMTLYYARTRNWAAAGITGMLCALSRSVGVFIIFPVTVELLEEEKIFDGFRSKLWPTLKKWLWLLLITVGTCVYLFINYRLTGDPFYFFDMEKKYWFQEGQPFFKTVGTLWNISTGTHTISTRFGAFIPGLVILFSMYAVMITGIRRHRSMYSVWIWVYLIVSTAMSWPLSICRYLAGAIPVYIFLGDECNKNKKLLAAFVIGFSILFGLFMLGHLMGKQIM